MALSDERKPNRWKLLAIHDHLQAVDRVEVDPLKICDQFLNAVDPDCETEIIDL
jgi:hypothetical protein